MILVPRCGGRPTPTAAGEWQMTNRASTAARNSGCAAPYCRACRASAMAVRNCPIGRAPRIMRSPTTKAGVPLIPSTLARHGVPIDQRVDGRILHVAREPVVVEADRARDLENVVEVEGAVGTHQRPVKRLVEALRPGCERRARGQRRFRPQDRELLEDEAQVVVFREQGFERGLHPSAVAAAIVEELDQRDGALWIARDRRLRVTRKSRRDSDEWPAPPQRRRPRRAWPAAPAGPRSAAPAARGDSRG